MIKINKITMIKNITFIRASIFLKNMFHLISSYEDGFFFRKKIRFSRTFSIYFLVYTIAVALSLP